MIKLFDVTDKTYSTNGDIVINPLKATVHKEDNGNYYLDLETNLSYVDYLIAGKIIVANTPRGDQAFRITNPQKTRSKITIKAYHVYYDSANYLIQDSYVVEKNCNDALDHLNRATSEPSPFTTLSDVTTVGSFRCVRQSLETAIKTVLERWGGHLVRDNFNIQIRETIGKDNGVVIRYAKNLKEITCEENWSDVVTKLLPVGKDGILLNALDSAVDVYVYSGLKYEIPYTKTVSFNQDKVKEDDFKDSQGKLNETEYKQALIKDLRQQAQDYVNKNCIPKVNYKINANIEKITDIGDTVEVIDERLGINLQTHVIAFDYDCILQQYKQIEFGNTQPKLSNLVSNVTSSVSAATKNEISTIQVTLTDDLMDATNAIWGVLGDSYVIYEGDKILVVDNLPKETATNVLMINNGGIGFSNTGINGTFTSAWTIDGTLNMQAINVINLTADLIKGGTLKLGSNLNSYGQLEVYDEANNLIAELNKSGLKVYGVDHSYVLINENVGFAGYDRLGNKIYWCDHDEFHMRKGVMEEEITLCNKLRFIPITITDTNNNITSDGIGLVSVATG